MFVDVVTRCVGVLRICVGVLRDVAVLGPIGVVLAPGRRR